MLVTPIEHVSEAWLKVMHMSAARPVAFQSVLPCYHTKLQLLAMS